MSDGSVSQTTSPPPLQGVTLEQYAGISAGLADEHPLAALLANEGLAPEVWSRAAPAWKARLGSDGMDGAVFTAFRDKLREAEDWLDRPVTPIDGDLGGWLSFLHVYGTHPAPFELLARVGLRMSDLARLQRRWAKRMAEDSAMQKRAAELVKKGPAPLPAIRVGVAELRPFPWSKGATTPERGLEQGDGAGAAAPEELPLDRYAAMAAELAEPACDRARVLARFGLTEASYPGLDAWWKDALRRDAQAARDYHRLFDHHRARRSASGPSEPAEPAASPRVFSAPSALAGTALALNVPRGPALPFVPGTAPPEVASATPPSVVVPRTDLGGTSLELNIPRVPALPFGDRKPAEVPAPAPLAGTALALDVPRRPALPFVEGAAPPEIAAAAAPAPWKHLKGPSLAGTINMDLSAILAAIRRGPIPFASSDTAPAGPSTGVPEAASAEQLDVPSRPLDAYAAVCGALAGGAPRDEVLAEHGITSEDFDRLAKAWAQRFERDPELHATFRAMARAHAESG